MKCTPCFHLHARFWRAASLVAAICLVRTGLAADPPPPNCRFIHGRWFDGRGFRRRVFYSVGGFLTRRKPPTVDDTVDLHDGFVVPPFAEAHNHNVEDSWTIDAVVRAYLKDGVFYVKIPGNIRQFSAQIADKINKPTNIDVTFANAGLTASGGHPIPLYEGILGRTRYAPVLGHVPKGWFNNRAYVIIDSEADLQRHWKGILAQHPDFIKTFLANSEEFQNHRRSTDPALRRGLNPALLPPIIARAHQAGLRVSAHVESAWDFHEAVRARVDEITHVPGCFAQTEQQAARARITSADARWAAAHGIVVVTTTVAEKFMSLDRHHASPGGNGAESHTGRAGHGPPVPQVRETVIRNLRLLHRCGVPLAIGSDHAPTSLAEAMNLHEMKLFDNRTLLKIWCDTTARAIFPKRKIGRLQEGYEASFLLLGGSPLKNFERVKEIRMRFKQGRRLAL